MNTLYLHAVVVKKEVGFPEAYKIARNIIKKKKRTWFRETEDSWRFRNIPKTQFDPTTFRTKQVNENVSLIFGHLRAEQ